MKVKTLKLPSKKHVPKKQYGHTRIPSSVPGPSVDGGGLSAGASGGMSAGAGATGGESGLQIGGSIEAPISAKPRIENPDKTFSTERTIGIDSGGSYYNIPTIIKGKAYTPEEAIAEWHAGRNPEVGKFNSREEADAAARKRTKTIGEREKELYGMKKGGSVPHPDRCNCLQCVKRKFDEGGSVDMRKPYHERVARELEEARKTPVEERLPNRMLGALAQAAKYADVHALKPIQEAAERIPLGFSGAASDYYSGKEKGLAGMLVPRLESTSNLASRLSREDLSAGPSLASSVGLYPRAALSNLAYPEAEDTAMEMANIIPAAKYGASTVGKIAKEQLPAMAARLAERYPLATSGVSPMYAVKPQGGQWIPGSSGRFTEEALYGPEAYWAKENQPHEDWAKKAFPKYLEKYFAATGNPIENIRILHGEETAKLGDLADRIVFNTPLDPEKHAQLIEKYPWAGKLEHGTPLYGIKGRGVEAQSIKDYFRKLAEHAKTIDPKKLPSYDVPRMATEVNALEEAKAAKLAAQQQAETNLLPDYKPAYPSGNVWKELTVPEELTEAQLKSVKEVHDPELDMKEYHALDPEGNLIVGEKPPNWPLDTEHIPPKAIGSSPRIALLKAQMIKEGNAMGNCVGSYCPKNILSGRQRIFSLRGPKGTSHATVEIGSPNWMEMNITPEMIGKHLTPEESAAVGYGSLDDVQKALGQERSDEIINKIISESPPDIKQIKGNVAPYQGIAEKYHPYAQDIVKSGNWGKVNDLSNIGLSKLQPHVIEHLESKGIKIPSPYVTPEDMKNFHKELFYKGAKKKKGGSVKCKPGGDCRCLSCLKRQYALGGLIRGYQEGGEITPDVLNAVSHVESRHNPNAIGPMTRYGTRAQGQFQFMPDTAKMLGIDPMNPTQAREGAARYLNQLIRETGSLKDALAAYNRGIGNVKKYGTNKLPKETENYVEKVMSLLTKNKAGQQPTVASAPSNPSDTTPQPEPGEGLGLMGKKLDELPINLQPPSGEPTPPGVGPLPAFGGGGGKLNFTKQAPISSPPINPKNNPMLMVDALLKDPMSLAKGEV